nr:hypothetical protein [uncultured Desulfobacter sp.]
MTTACVRKVLPNVTDFKAFWKKQGPFRYALTSNEYPPVLLAPEEWIFGQDKEAVIKELMQFSPRKMSFASAPFNPDNKSILRPDDICAWKIVHFPEEWNTMICEGFLPEGQLTRAVVDECVGLGLDQDKSGIEQAFFSLLERQLDGMGYVWLTPRGNAKSAFIHEYLDEWQQDEKEAGFL